MRRLNFVAALLVALMGLLASPAMAQSSMTYSGTKVWGTTPGGVSVVGASDSSLNHVENGTGAGQVKSANIGALFSSNFTQQNFAVGVYNQVSNNGNNNTLSTGQSGSNKGNTTNTGTNSLQTAGNSGGNTFNPW